MAETRVLLARHGETEWSRAGRHTGVSDLPLTERGREQAAALAPRLAGVKPALVLSSPRTRALETARLAGFDGDAVRVDSALAEWDYGDYEGITSDAIRDTRPGWSLWTDGAPGGESPEAVAERMDALIERLLAVNGLCLCFAHGHALRSLATRWLEQPMTFGARLALDTATLSGLGFDHGERALTLWNKTPPR